MMMIAVYSTSTPVPVYQYRCSVVSYCGGFLAPNVGSLPPDCTWHVSFKLEVNVGLLLNMVESVPN